MCQAQQGHRAILIVEDDAELRSLAAALFEDEQVDTITCESAEAALAIMLIGGRDVAMIFADIRLPGAMDGVDLGTVAVGLAQSMPRATDTLLRTGAWSAVQSNVTLTIPGAP